MKRRAVLLLAACLAAGPIAGCGDNEDSAAGPSPGPVTYFSGPVPRNIAHRGGAGIFPENTLYAFERALAMGVQILETDVHATRDGQIVILHDREVDRTTDGTGPVDGMTLEEVKRLDAAYRFTTDGGQTYPLRSTGITIPTLEEAFQRFPRARFCIEIKQERQYIEAELLALVEAYGMREKVCIGSFYDSVIRRVRALDPGVETGEGIGGILAFLLKPLRVLREEGVPARSLQVPEEQAGIRVLTPAFLEKAEALGVETHVGPSTRPRTWSGSSTWASRAS